MKADEFRVWLAPAPGSAAPEGTLGARDLADEDDRAALIRSQHPQMAAAIERGEDEIEVEGEVVNPHLHLAMHEVIVNRLWTGDPPSVRQTAEELLHQGHSHHEVLHLLGADAMREIWQGLRSLEFDADDEEGALDASDALLEDHREWLAERGAPEDDWVADQMLHCKWGYLDGNLGRWEVADLNEIFLHLFPRKVIVEAEDLGDILPAAGRFLEFLQERGWLAHGSDPLPQLLRALDSMSEPFLNEMQNPAAFGIAKSLFSGAAHEGIDFSDPAAIEAWIQDFNARPYEERAGLMPGPVGGIVLPPMALPSEDVLAAQALETLAMRQLAAFLEWVGGGRALTQKGNLKLADGKELIGLLGTTDTFDETIGDQTFKTSSTTELTGVDLVYRLALKARLARKQHGAVRRTKRGARLSANGLGAWHDVVNAMLDLGVIGAGREDHYGLRWWQEFFEEGASRLLCLLAVAGQPMPMKTLIESAHEELADAYDLDSLPDVHHAALPHSVAWAVATLVARLVWLGMLTWEGAVTETDELGLERRSGGEIALTDLGRWFARPLLTTHGVTVPVPGDLVGKPASELLDAITAWPEEAAKAELQAWARGRDTAATELAEAARGGSPDRFALVLCALESIGEAAEPAVRALLEDPTLRPLAAAWLVSQGYEELDFLQPRDTPAAFIQALAIGLVTGGAEAVTEMFAAGAETHEQVAILEELWSVDDPYTEPILEAITSAPDKRVAKAARKALFKYRSVRR